MVYFYSLYDALISINVPNDKARAVVDAMELDMGTTLATKTDLLSIRQEIEYRYGLLSQEIAAVRMDVNKDLQPLELAMSGTGYLACDAAWVQTMILIMSIKSD